MFIYLYATRMNHAFLLMIGSNKYHTPSTNVRFSNIDLRFVQKAIKDRCFVQYYMLN